jgi:hypothetical protein
MLLNQEAEVALVVQECGPHLQQNANNQVGMVITKQNKQTDTTNNWTQTDILRDLSSPVIQSCLDQTLNPDSMHECVALSAPA